MATIGFTEFQIPFCGPFNCSKSEALATEDGEYREMALWDCMPHRCRRNMEAFAVTLLILSALTTWLNVMVLSANLLKRTRRILGRNSTMQNYSNYVVSLALADLVMGALVMPLAIIFFYNEVLTPRKERRQGPSLVDAMKRNESDMYELWPLDSTLATNNVSQRFVAQDILHGPSSMLHFLGFLMHTSIFVSVYTLAASSGDRFYVSTRPNKNNGIRLSRSSLRRLSVTPSCGDRVLLGGGISRSTIVVLAIWVLGVLFALLPFWLHGCYYHHVGHVFAAFSFNGYQNLTFSWYSAVLSLPLATTWLFSILLTLLLRRRKQRLKRSSKNTSKSKEMKRFLDRDAESSFVMTSRYSNTETPIVRNVTRASSSDDGISTNHEESLQEVFVNDKATSDRGLQRPKFFKAASLPPSATVPCSRRRRPSSLDSSLIARRFEVGAMHGSTGSVDKRATRERFLLKCHSTEEGLPASYVAKRILFRRSWEGPNNPEDHQQTSSNSTMSSTKRSEHRATSTNSATSPPTSPSQTQTRRCDSTRSASRTISTRVRRRSSIYRAKEFITSRSFESNIARTLVAVIAVFTVAVLPLLIVLSQIKPWDQSSLAKRNNDATSLVVAITILLSNSLWNCLIYGARMPYFRDAMSHIVRKVFCCRRSTSCTKVLSRKLSMNSSLRRNSELRRPTWM